jgi:hypothetical protein
MAFHTRNRYFSAMDTQYAGPMPRPTGNRQSLVVKVAARVAVFLLMGALAARVLDYSAASMKDQTRPAGFATGMLHGACMPCTWPMLALGRNPPIYAENNAGQPYKLGYTLGVNTCGLIFFGLLFWRLQRWRKAMTAKTRP